MDAGIHDDSGAATDGSLSRVEMWLFLQYWLWLWLQVLLWVVVETVQPAMWLLVA